MTACNLGLVVIGGYAFAFLLLWLKADREIDRLKAEIPKRDSLGRFAKKGQ